MDYLSWNKLLGTHFFNPKSAQRPIYLFVTPELLDELGRPHSADSADFVHAVSRGPDWITDNRLSLCGTAYRLFQDWKTSPHTRDLEYPPFIAYLCLFSLAAGLEGDFAPHAYYPRLHRLLGEDEESGTPPVFDRMWELWLAVEDWSKSEMEGEWGVFNFNIFGGWDHVGLPVGQTLISDDERHALPGLFRDLALDPDTPPSNAEMLSVLREHAGHLFHRRTRSLLGPSSNAGARAALVQAVIAELEHWDGTSPTDGDDERASEASAALRICCRLDLAAANIQFRLRCKASTPFPDTGLQLAGPAVDSPLTCEEESLGWSTELAHSGKLSPFDATSLNWQQRVTLVDPERGWIVIAPPAAVRLFVPGSEFGLPWYVETSRLPRGQEFLIAACEHESRIASWGEDACSHFRKLRIIQGLPEGWSLYMGANPSTDAAVRDLVPRLSLPTDLKIRFRGGIRTKDGNTSRYFNFAPPQIVVECPEEELHVSCDGLGINPDDAANRTYSLPDTSPLDVPIRVEARTKDGCEVRASLTLTAPAFSRWQEQEVRVDSLGLCHSRLGGGVRGAFVDSDACPPFNFGTAIPPISASRITLLGRMPGQLAMWPCRNPPSWEVIWALARVRRRGFVVPCMAEAENADPIAREYGSRRNVKARKELVWHGRKRFAPPREPWFQEIWERYLEVARNV